MVWCGWRWTVWWGNSSRGSAVGAGQTGGHHLRGGSLEEARRLGRASGSSLSVTGVAEMGGDEIQMVDGNSRETVR